MFTATKIHPEIRKLSKTISQKFPGAEIFLVGGGVRDLLLTKTCTDYDILVRGVPAKKLESFLKTLGKVNLVGKNFGVFKFQITSSKLQIDIALPRTEYSLGKTGAYRDFKIQTDYKLKIEDDLTRRDFTINAIAYNLLTQELIDPWQGQKDLKKKIIRAVGQPTERFAEDYSRMLRAIRFACQLDFAIDPKTWVAIKKLVKNINKKSKGDFVIPRETIAAELLKTFYANPGKALELLDQAGLIKELMPILLQMKGCAQPDNWHSEGDVWEHTLLCFKNLQSAKYRRKFKDQPSINLVLGLLFHDAGKPLTIQTPERDGTDRIRFNGHDLAGAELVKKYCQELKLTSYKNNNIDCSCDNLFWLVKNHMLTVHGKIAEMKNTTIEKYFFSDQPGDDLLRLIYVDAISTVPREDEIYVEHYKALMKRISKLEKLKGAKPKILPRPLLDGREIMKLTKVKPGPQVGQLIKKLREEQLKGKVKTKKTARAFIKKLN